MSKIIGATVGTPTSPAKMEKELKPVKTVNGKEPDENGNVEVEGAGGKGAVTSVNGVLPDENGNVQIETGVTADEVLEVLPKVSAIDFSNFANGSFAETADGETITHSVTFDESGRPVTIDGISITWEAVT